MLYENVIVDCDPGIDDAVAILNLLNTSFINLNLISTVSGNLTIEETVKNALQLVEIFGKPIGKEPPVSVGADGPLVRQAVYASMAQGSTGLGGYQFSTPKRKPIELKGEDAIYYYLKQNELQGTTLVCIGSMTNVARLLTEYGDAAKMIKKIVFMGGSKDEDGSTVPYREFNVAFDPEALKIVIKSGVPLVMVPMELGHFAFFDKEEIEKIRKANSVGKIIGKMFDKYHDFHMGKYGAAVHDSCAALYVITPEIFKTEDAKIDIKYYKKDDGTEYGYIKCVVGADKPNAQVCVDVDIETFKKIIYGNIFSYNV